MSNYIETKVRYRRTLESGHEKTVTELYLVDAVTFGDTEVKITEALKPYMKRDSGFEVNAVKRSNITETIGDLDTDRFFKAKVNIVTMDDSGKEKKTPVHILIGADDIDEAKALVQDWMKDSLADTELSSLSETTVLGVYQ